MSRRFWLRVAAIAWGVGIGLNAANCGMDTKPEAAQMVPGSSIPGQIHSRPAPKAAPREVKFYQDEPSCPEKKLGYVVLRGSFATTEHHRVWVCGLEYSK